MLNMTKWRATWLTASASLYCLITGAAPRIALAQAGNAPTVVSRIDSVVRSVATTGRFAGTVLVARSGRIIFERSYGLANVELGVPASNQLRYRVHSVTKQFTAAAVMLLAERGKVSLDASIREYLPELPAAWSTSTIVELLTHTSGIPNAEGVWSSAFNHAEVVTQLDALRFIAPAIARDSLVEHPGVHWRYNNFAYDLLACVVERVTGEQFAVFLRHNIFERAGMRDAGFDERRRTPDGSYVEPAVVSRLASGYNGSPDSLQVAAPYMYASLGAGGMYATAEDLMRYSSALDQGTVLAPGTVTMMVERAVPVRPNVRYGLGWVVTRAASGAVYVHHSGGTNGYISEFARYPAEDTCVILLSDRGFADTDALRDDIASIIFGDKYAR